MAADGPEVSPSGDGGIHESIRPVPAEGPPHRSVLLYYRYFPDDVLAATGADVSVQSLVSHQRTLCRRFGLRGRVLISSEGINGTVSGADADVLREYIGAMESTVLGACGTVEEAGTEGPRPFAGVDWKWSSAGGTRHIFPDLKVEPAKEIVSTGGSVSVRDVVEHGGTHLDPHQFHAMLTSRPPADRPPVLLDVRNTFEHAVGHFVGADGAPAEQPAAMTNFSTFEREYCKKNAGALADRTVMMYCTGGIRCEKASAALKKHGVREVYQLRGGIHRYLEEYPTGGMFRGKNFVFDQRVTAGGGGGDVVGRCLACRAPYDELCGSRVCAVCRDLVLVCPDCRSARRELHCRRHAYLATCYFAFLEPFTTEELSWQLEGLRSAREAQESTNVRKTIMKQIVRVAARLEVLKAGEAAADPGAPRRCRTCMEPSNICDGRCWGFWRRSVPIDIETQAEKGKEGSLPVPTPAPISVGSRVAPGADWNELRLGESAGDRRGTVVETKSWGTGRSATPDAVKVLWDVAERGGRVRGAELYRWGVLSHDGTRLMYDVQKVDA